MASAAIAASAVAPSSLTACSDPHQQHQRQTGAMVSTASATPLLRCLPGSLSSDFRGGAAALAAPHRQSAAAVKSVCQGAVRCAASGGDSSGSSSGGQIWVGRAAMVAFVAAVTLEVVTGKGLLENIGVPTPLPALALALVAAVGGVLAFGVFRSASSDE